MIDEIARPIDKGNIASPWLTGSPKLVEALQKIIGKSGYRARKGVDTSLNAVFWVRELDQRPGEVLVENCQTRSRSEVRQRKLWIESEVLFPHAARSLAQALQNGPQQSTIGAVLDADRGSPLKLNVDHTA